MRWEQKVEFAALSDIGFRRRNNQDAQVVMLSPDAETFQSRGHLFVVADGMGGHAVGELASKLAVDTLPHSYFKNRTDDMPLALSAAIHQANAIIHERGSQNIDFNRMGTTCVALVLGPTGGIAGHVGDSRLYRIRREQIEQLTFDHSLEWELIRHTRAKSDFHLMPEARHVITRSIGPEPTVEPEVEGPFAVWPGDIYLLCSDGLSGLVSDPEIGAIAKQLPPEEACQVLVHLANLRGGPDNITVVIAHVGKLPEGVVPSPDEQPNSENESDDSDGLWLAGLWVCALGFALGVVWGMLQDRVLGACLSVVSAVAAAGIGLLWRSARRREAEAIVPAEVPRKAFKPYRTASAKLTPEFLVTLARELGDLKQQAQTDKWTYDASAHDTADKAAKAAYDQKQWATSLKELCKICDVLMAGLLQHRKQIAKEAEAKKAAEAAAALAAPKAAAPPVPVVATSAADGPSTG